MKETAQEILEIKTLKIKILEIQETKVIVQTEKVVNSTPLLFKKSHGFRWLFTYL